MTTYYRVDGARLSYGEYWRMSPGPLGFLIAAGCKLFGFPIQFHFVIPRPDRLFLVEFEELPAAALQAMKPAIRSAEKAGLRLIFAHRLAVPEPHRLGAAALMLDEENETGSMIVFGQQGDHRELHATCASRFADDTLGTMTTMKRTMIPTPGQDIERYPGASAGALYQRHREHLERLAGQGFIPLTLDPNRLKQFVLECELRNVDFHFARSVRPHDRGRTRCRER